MPLPKELIDQANADKNKSLNNPRKSQLNNKREDKKIEERKSMDFADSEESPEEFDPTRNNRMSAAQEILEAQIGAVSDVELVVRNALMGASNRNKKDKVLLNKEEQYMADRPIASRNTMKLPTGVSQSYDFSNQ